MKREQLKKLIKPIIKECIHEVIMESGVLTTIITEVTNGLGVVRSKQQLVVEQQTPQTTHSQDTMKLQKERLKDQRKQLTAAIGNKAYVNIFEGVEPMLSQGDTASSAGALSGVAPHDAGIDISGIVALGGKGWKTLATGKKR